MSQPIANRGAILDLPRSPPVPSVAPPAVPKGGVLSSTFVFPGSSSLPASSLTDDDVASTQRRLDLSRRPSLSSYPSGSLDLQLMQEWDSKLVINLSGANLDPLSFNFLKRGLGFAPSPRFIPHVDFLIEIENLVRYLPSNLAEEVRQDCAVALRHAKPPKGNVPSAELRAFKKLE
ncbi:hypothetical protein SUGI_0172360 [Cryptomeria japonica]|nr:hypothetical protein SUGI_0172360 [Cryptomeria japonica]